MVKNKTDGYAEISHSISRMNTEHKAGAEFEPSTFGLFGEKKYSYLGRHVPLQAWTSKIPKHFA